MLLEYIIERIVNTVSSLLFECYICCSLLYVIFSALHHIVIKETQIYRGMGMIPLLTYY